MTGPLKILAAICEESQLDLMRAARQLAKESGASLTGLFVEDINLIRAAQLACVREIGAVFARSEHDLEKVERRLRAKATLIQRSFQGRLETPSDAMIFSVTRGVVEEEILKAELGMDLLLLSSPFRERRRSFFGSSIINTIIQRSSGPIILLPQKSVLGKDLLVIQDNSPSSGLLIEQARFYARIFNWRIKILSLASSADAPPFNPVGENEERILFPGWSVLYQYLVENRDKLLILPAEAAIMNTTGLMNLLQDIGMPLLLTKLNNKEPA